MPKEGASSARSNRSWALVGLSSSMFGCCEALGNRAGRSLMGIDGFGFLKATVCKQCQGLGWHGEARVIEWGSLLSREEAFPKG